MQFGHATGLAFQIQDDILGIWGDPAVTGKAAGNDILRRKKSLPLLYALNHPEVGEQLHAIFAGEITPDQLPAVMELLDQAGTRSFAEEQMHAQHALAVEALTQRPGRPCRRLPAHGPGRQPPVPYRLIRTCHRFTLSPCRRRTK